MHETLLNLAAAPLPAPIVAALSAPATLAVSEDDVKLIGLVGILAFGAILAVLHTVRKVSQTQERERTRREIAAYVAEGSLTPDDAARLLNAGMSEDVATQLARGVTWGTVSAKRAQEMVRALQTPTSPINPNQRQA